MSRMFAEGQMWPDKFVSCSAEVPPGLLGVVDLCRLGDQMLNIPPRQLRTGARDMKQNIIKRILPSVRVLHRLKPQWKHFNSVWYSEKKPAGSSTWTLWRRLEGCFIGLTAHSIRHTCNAYTVLMLKFYWYINCWYETPPYFLQQVLHI